MRDGVEPERPARRIEVHLRHRLGELVLVAGIAVRRLQGLVHHLHRDIAVIGEEIRILLDLGTIGGDEIAVDGGVQHVRIDGRGDDAQGRLALRLDRGGIGKPGKAG